MYNPHTLTIWTGKKVCVSLLHPNTSGGHSFIQGKLCSADNTGLFPISDDKGNVIAIISAFSVSNIVLVGTG